MRNPSSLPVLSHLLLNSVTIVPRLLSYWLLVIVNAVGIAFLVAGYTGSALHVLGLGLLLPGSVIAGVLEAAVGPWFVSTARSEFWRFADILFLPSCIILNLLTLFLCRRDYRSLRTTRSDANLLSQRSSNPAWTAKLPRSVRFLGAVSAALIITGAAPLFAGRPILAHVFGEYDCACGDFHDQVTGFVVWNPFRDRSPERAADSFLNDIRANRCSRPDDLCRYALPDHRVSDWKLACREDLPAGVRLYYRLTKYGTSKPAYHLTGEGSVLVRRIGARSEVVWYSSYF